MTWLLWRQHRLQALVTGVGLALFAVAVVITGVHMAHVYEDVVRACPGNGTCEIVGHLFNGDGAIIDLVHLSIAVPVLLGVFLGVTLVARETEHATNVLVWTQSVTRRRWVLGKVGLAIVATLVISGAVSVLVTWWSGTLNSLDGSRFEGTQFDTQNVAPVAFALFAVTLGIAAGCFLRRTLPVLAVTVVGYAAVRILVVVYVRPHYMTVVTGSFPAGVDPTIPRGSWTMSTNLVDSTGRSLSGSLRIPDVCVGATRTGIQTCLDRLGFRTVVTYQPANRYWNFQWIESGLFVALAVGLAVFAVVSTLRRDA